MMCRYYYKKKLCKSSNRNGFNYCFKTHNFAILAKFALPQKFLIFPIFNCVNRISLAFRDTVNAKFDHTYSCAVQFAKLIQSSELVQPYGSTAKESTAYYLLLVISYGFK